MNWHHVSKQKHNSNDLFFYLVVVRRFFNFVHLMIWSELQIEFSIQVSTIYTFYMFQWKSPIKHIALATNLILV